MILIPFRDDPSDSEMYMVSGFEPFVPGMFDVMSSYFLNMSTELEWHGLEL